MSTEQVTYCNGKLSGAPSDAETIDPAADSPDGYCERPAGWGTDHVGEGRCKLHGGNAGAPTSHGLYSFRREELREKLSAADGMESPGDLWTEVAVLRTLLSDYLEDVDEVDGDVLQDVSKIQKELRRTVDNIHEMMVRTRPTQEEVQRLINSFATILRKYVPEADRTDALDELDRAVGDGRRAALEGGGK